MRAKIYNNGDMALKTEIPRNELESICKRYYVRLLALFGSVPGEDGPDSDIDVLVEFEPYRTPGLDFVRLQRELTDVMGHPVDVYTYHSLSRCFRDEVLEQSQYARGCSRT